MGLVRWFTKNWANTLEPTHSDLGPITVPVPVDVAPSCIRKAVATLPRWQVVSESSQELRLTRTTPIARFVDDIVLTFEPHATGTVVQASSKSRVGIGDLGQNRRNILELWAAVRAVSATS